MYESKKYRKTRVLYIMECTFEYWVALMVSDSFLSSLLADTGMSDSTIGVVSSFISLAFMFQILAVPVINRIKDTKKFAIIIHTVGQLSFGFLFLTPVLPITKGQMRAQAILLILFAYFCNYFVNTITFRWGTSFVDPNHRGVFAARRDMTSLISGVIIQLLAGIIVDYFVGIDSLHGGFIFIAVSIMIFSACDFCMLLSMERERQPEVKAEKAEISEILRATMGQKKFLSAVLLEIFWKCAMYSVLGFVGTYKLNELGMSLTLIQIVNIAGALVRFALSAPYGKFTDRFGYSKGMNLGVATGALGFLALAFTGTNTWWLVIAFTVLYHGSQASAYSCMLYMTYECVDLRFISEALAIKNAICGICGFGMSIVCGRILANIQANGFTFCGKEIFGQQILACIALALALAAIIFNAAVVRRQLKEKD